MSDVYTDVIEGYLIASIKVKHKNIKFCNWIFVNMNNFSAGWMVHLWHVLDPEGSLPELGVRAEAKRGILRIRKNFQSEPH